MTLHLVHVQHLQAVTGRYAVGCHGTIGREVARHDLLLVGKALFPSLPDFLAGERHSQGVTHAGGQGQDNALRLIVVDDVLVGVLIVDFEVLQRVLILVIDFPLVVVALFPDGKIVHGDVVVIDVTVLPDGERVTVGQLNLVNRQGNFLGYPARHQQAQQQQHYCRCNSNQVGDVRFAVHIFSFEFTLFRFIGLSTSKYPSYLSNVR